MGWRVILGSAAPLRVQSALRRFAYGFSLVVLYSTIFVWPGKSCYHCAFFIQLAQVQMQMLLDMGMGKPLSELSPSRHYGVECECSHVRMCTNASEGGAMFSRNGASALITLLYLAVEVSVPTMIQRPSISPISKSPTYLSPSRTCVGSAAPSEDRRGGDMEALHTFPPHDVKQRPDGQ